MIVAARRSSSHIAALLLAATLAACPASPTAGDGEIGEGEGEGEGEGDVGEGEGDVGEGGGEVVCGRPVACSIGQVVELLDRFTGPISQLPPMHSALKKDGKALYEYARAGIEIEREPRQVTIHELELLGLDLACDAPWLRLRVSCSKGTYIRTLGEDIGEALGCGAHLSELRRIRTGGFELSRCITIEALEAMPEAERLRALLPVDTLLAGHERVTLSEQDAGRFLSGMRRRGPWPDAEQVAVYADHPTALLGTASIKAGELIPGRLLSPIEIQQILESQA